jgi:hypothetical protein
MDCLNKHRGTTSDLAQGKCKNQIKGCARTQESEKKSGLQKIPGLYVLQLAQPPNDIGNNCWLKRRPSPGAQVSLLVDVTREPDQLRNSCPRGAARRGAISLGREATDA